MVLSSRKLFICSIESKKNDIGLCFIKYCELYKVVCRFNVQQLRLKILLILALYVRSQEFKAEK